MKYYIAVFFSPSKTLAWIYLYTFASGKVSTVSTMDTPSHRPLIRSTADLGACHWWIAELEHKCSAMTIGCLFSSWCVSYTGKNNHLVDVSHQRWSVCGVVLIINKYGIGGPRLKRRIDGTDKWSSVIWRFIFSHPLFSWKCPWNKVMGLKMKTRGAVSSGCVGESMWVCSWETRICCRNLGPWTAHVWTWQMLNSSRDELSS